MVNGHNPIKVLSTEIILISHHFSFFELASARAIVFMRSSVLFNNNHCEEVTTEAICYSTNQNHAKINSGVHTIRTGKFHGTRPDRVEIHGPKDRCGQLYGLCHRLHIGSLTAHIGKRQDR